MSVLHRIGKLVATSALVVLGAAGGVATLAAVDPAPAVSAPSVAAVTPTPAHPEEDEPGFNCATDGNHVCGPDNSEGIPAGCYDDGGVLVVPWTRYDNPSQDTLYGQLASPCQGQAPTQEQESDTAFAAAQTDETPECDTDAACAAWDEAHGQATSGYGAERHRTAAATTRPVAGSCSEPIPAPPVTPAPAPQTQPLVNVNTATVAQLDALPGIGDVLAARIVAQRPYASVDDLHRVARIPSKVFPLVTV